MDAEKNVVEAARKLTDAVYAEHFGSSYKRVRVDCLLVNKLQAALSAYDAARKDSAPAPSEDRVREAAEAVVDALLTVGGDKRGDRLVIKQGPLHNERDLGGNCRGSAIYWAGEALKPYVTPAPALPAGTVVARLEWLRLMLTVAKQRDCSEIVDEIEGFLAKLPHPEPPKELVAEWERKATKYVRDLMLGGPDATFLEHSPHVMRAYVAALRAAWEADPERKP